MKHKHMEIIEMSENARISIVEHYTGKYTMCVLFNMFPYLEDKWEIEGEVYEAGSMSEIYGIINNVIQPEWYEYTGFEKI